MNLENCKVGDYLYTSRYGTETLYKITAETKTQWICDDVKFRKDSGKRVGGGAWSSYAFKATPEKQKNIQIKIEINIVQKNLSIVKVDLENLEICKDFLSKLNKDRANDD